MNIFLSIVVVLAFGMQWQPRAVASSPHIIKTGTLIIVVRTNEGVVMAGDRREIQTSSSGQFEKALNVVKVVPVDRFRAFAVVHFGGEAPGPKHPFSVRDIVRNWLPGKRQTISLAHDLEPLARVLEHRFTAYLNKPNAMIPPESASDDFVSEIAVAEWNTMKRAGEVATIDVRYNTVGSKYIARATVSSSSVNPLISGEFDALELLYGSDEYAAYRNKPAIVNFPLKPPWRQVDVRVSQDAAIAFCREMISDGYEINMGRMGGSPFGPTADIAAITQHGFEWVYRDKPLPSV